MYLGATGLPVVFPNAHGQARGTQSSHPSIQG